MHEVHEKIPGEPFCKVSFSENPIVINDEVEQIIKKRLIDAAGRDSRSFELKINKTDNGSFFELSKEIIESDGDSFFENSKKIVTLLGESQTHHIIPGGYLIIILASDEESRPVIIVIKAEPHEALKVLPNDQISLEKVFLSPSQKLYKIGVLHQLTNGASLSSDMFTSYLFDEQFRQDGHPAEYFYSSFLGLSVSENAKIQTHQFFAKTEAFILKHISNASDKHKQFTHLRSYIGSNITTIRPIDFANNYMLPITKDMYISQVVQELPSSFVKNPVLIKNNIKQRKISFAGNVKIIAPETSFSEKKITIFNDKSQLDKIDLSNDEYSILLIKGLPFTND
jgi:hypothetical protein